MPEFIGLEPCSVGRYSKEAFIAMTLNGPKNNFYRDTAFRQIYLELERLSWENKLVKFSGNRS